MVNRLSRTIDYLRDKLEEKDKDYKESMERERARLQARIEKFEDPDCKIMQFLIMSLEDWIELNDIDVIIVTNYDISLRDFKELYLWAKEIFDNRKSYFELKDINLLLGILGRIFDKVKNFWQNWQSKKTSPTDEELDLLEYMFEEGSQIFNQLSESYPHSFSLKNNQIRQRLLQEKKQIIIEEKEQRKNKNSFPNPPRINTNNEKEPNKLVSWIIGGAVVLLLLLLTIIVLLIKKKDLNKCGSVEQREKAFKQIAKNVSDHQNFHFFPSQEQNQTPREVHGFHRDDKVIVRNNDRELIYEAVVNDDEVNRLDKQLSLGNL